MALPTRGAQDSRVNHWISAINELIQRSPSLSNELRCDIRRTPDKPSKFGHILPQQPPGCLIVVENAHGGILLSGIITDISEEARQTHEAQFASWKYAQDGDCAFEERRKGQDRYFFVCCKPGTIDFYAANDNGIAEVQRNFDEWESQFEFILRLTIQNFGKYKFYQGEATK